jgi:hypothetical protein
MRPILADWRATQQTTCSQMAEPQTVPAVVTQRNYETDFGRFTFLE